MTQKARYSAEKYGLVADATPNPGKAGSKRGRVFAPGRTLSIHFEGEAKPTTFVIKSFARSFRGKLKGGVLTFFGDAAAGQSMATAKIEPAALASVFTDTGAFLSEPALKAFAEGMKTVEPTKALVAAMARVKSIRRA